MKKYNMKPKPKGWRHPGRYSVELENRILNLYDNGVSARKIAKKLNKDVTPIVRVLKRNNRRICTNKGSDHPMWKGGRGIKSGYWTVYNPKHPRALNIGRVWEHILVAEKKLGRPIRKDEPIHHIDCDRLNNHPNNLYICRDSSEHQSVHLSLKNISTELYKTGFIVFENGQYIMSSRISELVASRLK